MENNEKIYDVKLTEKELNKLVANLFILQYNEENIKEKLLLNEIMTALIVSKRYGVNKDD